MVIDPGSIPDDIDGLKRMIVGMAWEAVHANTLIVKLRGEPFRIKRVQFGVSSEKLKARVEQLELTIEALEVDEAQRLAAPRSWPPAPNRPGASRPITYLARA